MDGGAWKQKRSASSHERRGCSPVIRLGAQVALPPGMDQIDGELVEVLRSIVGDSVEESILRRLLLRAGGDVASAANSFFDGGVATLNDGPTIAAPTSAPQVGDDVLGTLFKTLEDQGRKLAGALTCCSTRARAATSAPALHDSPRGGLRSLPPERRVCPDAP